MYSRICDKPKNDFDVQVSSNTEKTFKQHTVPSANSKHFVMAYVFTVTTADCQGKYD